MNFYERNVLPTLLDLAMRQSQLDEYRRRVASQAYGRVLEIGVGSGLISHDMASKLRPSSAWTPLHACCQWRISAPKRQGSPLGWFKALRRLYPLQTESWIAS
jgi:hypothetical protein